MSEQDFKIEEVFESAVTIVQNLPKEGPIRPSDELKLKLYAYYKQATCGPNTTPKPRFYQIVEQYKWSAWLKLGDMPREEAMSCYINELKQIMDSIPEDQTDPEENKQFEEVLGKKFYDYWFNEWERKSARQEALALGHTTGAGGVSGSTRQQSSKGNGGDAQSNSSDGSSVSLLDETRSPDGDGYRTPTSLEQSCSITGGQMSDQFALAVLRLQHGLDETSNRLTRLEEQMRQSIESIRSLEHQTIPKQMVEVPPGGRRKIGAGSRDGGGGGCAGKLLGYLSQVKTVHWFYLSYPILVYVIIRAIERRRKSSRSALR